MSTSRCAPGTEGFTRAGAVSWSSWAASSPACAALAGACSAGAPCFGASAPASGCSADGGCGCSAAGVALQLRQLLAGQPVAGHHPAHGQPDDLLGAPA